MENEKLVFKAEEIFVEIPGDPDNVIMNIPQEICEKQGWKEGDVLDINLVDGALVIKKHV